MIEQFDEKELRQLRDNSKGYRGWKDLVQLNLRALPLQHSTSLLELCLAGENKFPVQQNCSRE